MRYPIPIYVLAFAAFGLFRLGIQAQTDDAAFYLVGAFLLGGVSWVWAHSFRRDEQQSRDEAADRVAAEMERQRANEILASPNEQLFVLYLRPFSLEKRIRERPDMGIWSWMMKSVGFEASLQDALGADIPILALGWSDGTLGAGHIVTADDEWRQRFHALAERARSILMIPGRQPGILAELHWLRVSGLLGNTVFFKPKGYPKAEWEEVRKLFEEEDIELPDYDAHQTSFLIYVTGRVHDLVVWKRSRQIELGKRQMRALLMHGSIEEKRD